MDKKDPSEVSNKNILRQYITFGTELGIMLFLAVWGGKKLDTHCSFSKPIFVWVLPLFVMMSMFLKLFYDMSNNPKKKKNE